MPYSVCTKFRIIIRESVIVVNDCFILPMQSLLNLLVRKTPHNWTTSAARPGRPNAYRWWFCRRVHLAGSVITVRLGHLLRDDGDGRQGIRLFLVHVAEVPCRH